MYDSKTWENKWRAQVFVSRPLMIPCGEGWACHGGAGNAKTAKTVKKTWPTRNAKKNHERHSSNMVLGR